MDKLEIFLLGSVKFQLGGEDITDSLRTKKERAILAFLAEEPPQPQSRQKVAEFFWPDRPENYARMNLRQALLGIRKPFNSEENLLNYLRIDEETLRLIHKNTWRDTAVFSELMLGVKSHVHQHLHTCHDCLGRLGQAIELYRGDFLEDLLLGDVTAFQEWIIYHRERHFRTMLEALQLLTKIYYKQGNYDQAYGYAWRYVDLAPMEEPAHRLLMTLLTLSGRRNAALQQYEFCKSIIQREFGIEPSNETRQLYNKIKNGLPIDKIDTGQLAFPAVPPESGNQTAEWSNLELLYDPATQLPNRALFMDRLRHAIARMDRAQMGVGVCVLAMSFPNNRDLENDVKQQVEQHVLRRLVGTVREGDTIGVLQENEYGLLLEEIKDPQVINTIEKKIMEVASAPVVIQRLHIKVRLVCGHAVFPADGRDAAGLLNQADVAMRQNMLELKL